MLVLVENSGIGPITCRRECFESIALRGESPKGSTSVYFCTMLSRYILTCKQPKSERPLALLENFEP